MKNDTEIFVIMRGVKAGMSYTSTEWMRALDKAFSNPDNICFSAKEFLDKIKEESE